ncbi:MAG: hypothetical protein V4601_10805 [Pseudomonadota bacterium]
MPHYYFHVREGSDISRDEEGQDLPNVEAARREAISSSREILGEKLLHGGSLNHRTIEIADETGHVVDTVSSNDVLFKGGKYRTFSDDVTQSAPVTQPRKSPSK